ncbi:MAG: hypothetical protein AAF587_32065 [Bacteroidota bacterium]
MKRNKTPDQKTGDQTYVISAPIVEKRFVKKNGQAIDRKELYIQRSIQDYFIKFCESAVSREELEQELAKIDGLIKTLTVEVEFRDGAWDICDEQDQQQSRMGKYVIVHKIVSTK